MRKIHTKGLRDGDEVIVFGAVVRLSGKPLVIEAPGRNRMIYTWPNMPIIKGSIDWAPEAAVWSIQGGPERTWLVTRRAGVR